VKHGDIINGWRISYYAARTLNPWRADNHSKHMTLGADSCESLRRMMAEEATPAQQKELDGLKNTR
jgi:hypothetical protein